MMLSSICVIGNLNIDLIIRQVPHLPAWGQEVLGTSHMQVSSGQAGYLSFALSRLGIPPSLIGNVGEDMLGKQILADLDAYGVDLRGVWVTPGGQTGITVAIVREGWGTCLRFKPGLSDGFLRANGASPLESGQRCLNRLPGRDFRLTWFGLPIHLPAFIGCPPGGEDDHAGYWLGFCWMDRRYPGGDAYHLKAGHTVHAQPG